MSTNEQAWQDFQQLRVRTRKAPLCYSRDATSLDTQQARVDAQSKAAVVVLGVVTCVAAFLVASGGWGI